MSIYDILHSCSGFSPVSQGDSKYGKVKVFKRHLLASGVPQGSLLDPFLFSVYGIPFNVDDAQLSSTLISQNEWGIQEICLTNLYS